MNIKVGGIGMNPLLTVFIIGVLGYLLGSIKVKGLSLGTSGVLIVALLFGHYGMEIPSVDVYKRQVSYHPIRKG